VSQYELHKEILESKRYLLPGMGAPIQFPGTSLADGVIACTAPGGPTHAVTDPVHRTSFATRMRSERVVSRSKSFRSANRFASESRCNVSPHPALPFLRITPSTLYALAARPWTKRALLNPTHATEQQIAWETSATAIASHVKSRIRSRKRRIPTENIRRRTQDNRSCVEKRKHHGPHPRFPSYSSSEPRQGPLLLRHQEYRV